MGTSKVSRREFIKFAGFAAGAAVLGACAPQVVTQIVKETEIVNQTQVVNPHAGSTLPNVSGPSVVQRRRIKAKMATCTGDRGVRCCAASATH